MLTIRNAAANFASQSWIAFMGLAFLPVYIKVLGPESYGVVGVMASLSAVLALLDLGLSQTLNREMARTSGAQEGPQVFADLKVTFECIYWLMAGLVALLIWFGSGWIANRWLNPGQIRPEDLQRAIATIAVIIGVRWPIAVYTGALNGLQKQANVAAVGALAATVQGVGAVFVLLYVSPSLQAFLAWQGAAAALHVALLRWRLVRALPGASIRGRLDWSIVARNWRFAAVVSGITLSGTLLSQIDKLVLSKFLDLSDFGYYMFAVNVASMIMRLAQPLGTAYFPRFAQIAVLRNDKNLAAEYSLACQLMTALIIPAATTLAFFSSELLRAWTRHEDLVGEAGTVVAMLALANMFNALAILPSSLQLAGGRPALVLWSNWVAVAFLVPLTFVLSMRWGGVGAAASWLAVNAVYFLVASGLARRRLAAGEASSESPMRLVAVPLLCCTAIGAAGKWCAAQVEAPALQAGIAVGVGGVALVATLAAMPRLRQWVVGRLHTADRVGI